MNVDLNKRVIRYGTDQPLPVQTVLHAGLLSAVLEDGMLRYIRFGKHELVRGVYVAVRDKNWGTIPLDLQSLKTVQNEESFCVTFTGEHKQNEIHYVWKGTIEGYSDGVVRYTMDGIAKSSFLKNRIGFCVLHPMELAGTSLQVVTSKGIVSGQFPVDISPNQPFFDITAIRHQVGEHLKVEIQFEGDIFEMEDQRNWTDASYKTYCTPLGLPFPVMVQEGQEMKQSVTISVKGSVDKRQVKTAPQNVTVKVELDKIGKFPSLGLAYSLDRKHSQREIEYLRRLNLEHLRVWIKLGSKAWDESLSSALEIGKELNVSLHLEVSNCENIEELLRLIKFLKADSALITKIVTKIFVFSESTSTTTGSDIQQVKELLEKYDLQIPVGGGSHAFFTQLNRAKLPISQMDFAGYTINPQVHAFDNTSLIETLAAQGETVRSARKIIGGLPLIVGPVTFKMRFNPDATDHSELSQTGLLNNFDPRQQSLFGAGWTIGSIRNLAMTDVSAFTYYETIGLRGIIQNESFLYPLYHVFADIGEFSDAEVLKMNISNPEAIESLALVKDSQVRILIANLTDFNQTVSLDTPNFTKAKLRMLDETNAVEAMSDPVKFRSSIHKKRQWFGSICMELSLLPFAVARVDLEL